MDIVVDTNIFLAVALNEPERAQIIALTTGASALAPEILPYEVGNALSAMVKRGKLTESEALEAEKSAAQIPSGWRRRTYRARSRSPWKMTSAPMMHISCTVHRCSRAACSRLTAV